MIDLDDPRYAAYASARNAYWTSLGTVDDDVLAYAISPEFTGAPPWPTTRQSFVVVRRSTSIIIASDGLSDLFVDTDIEEAGFGSEVYIETDELVGSGFMQIRDSWAFALIETFARNVANWGGINDRLDKLSVVSLELPAPHPMPSNWVSATGQVGVLVNVEHPERVDHLALDASNTIRIVPITLLALPELNAVIDGGAPARSALAGRFGQSGVGVLSTTRRGAFV